jgi:hypothetical protein
MSISGDFLQDRFFAQPILLETIHRRIPIAKELHLTSKLYDATKAGFHADENWWEWLEFHQNNRITYRATPTKDGSGWHGLHLETVSCDFNLRAVEAEFQERVKAGWYVKDLGEAEEDEDASISDEEEEGRDADGDEEMD